MCLCHSCINPPPCDPFLLHLLLNATLDDIADHKAGVRGGWEVEHGNVIQRMEAASATTTSCHLRESLVHVLC